jgi:hypothetical protein
MRDELSPEKSSFIGLDLAKRLIQVMHLELKARSFSEERFSDDLLQFLTSIQPCPNAMAAFVGSHYSRHSTLRWDRLSP